MFRIPLNFYTIYGFSQAFSYTNVALLSKNIKDEDIDTSFEKDDKLKDVVLCSIVGPFFEELVCRVIPSFLPTPLYFLVSGPVFGLLHYPNKIGYEKYFLKNKEENARKLAIYQSINATVTGICFALIYRKYKSFTLIFFTHSLTNSFSEYFGITIDQIKKWRNF